MVPTTEQQVHSWIQTAKGLDPNCPEDEAALAIEIVEYITDLKTTILELSE